MERRLSAVLIADVVGYGRLSQIDEEGTRARFQADLKGIFEPTIATHRGRLVKTMGDGLLIEFSSVVDAVRCAVEVQQEKTKRNANTPPDRRLDFRIGINLGDVIVEGDDIHGDGVNIADRMQTLAEPGGVVISGTASDHLQGNIDLPLEFLGEQPVKNIARPVRIYRVRLDGTATPPVFAPFGALRRYTALIAVALVMLVAAGGAAWYLYSSLQPPPHRISIVVLPFTNLGKDPEEDYFADGITDDLTTDLSRIDDSFVIAPNTARTYKGKAVDARQLGRELGVRYIMEGSLRRTGNQIRVNAQLIDAESGAEVWADRIEGDWTKSMELQDQITARLARALDVALTAAESRRGQLERPNNPTAVDLTMRAWSVLNQPLSREQLAQAQELFEQALRIDAKLPKALIGLASTLTLAVQYRWSDTPAEQLSKADNAITGVLAELPNDGMAHFVKGEILRARKEFDAAISEYQVALSLNPSLASAYSSLGNAEIRAGRAQEALEPLATAIRLSPRDPLLNLWYFNICHAYTHLGQDQAAIEWCRRSVAVSPFWISYVDLASAYAWTKQDAEAHAAVAELRKLMPNYTVDRWRHEGWSDNPVFLAQYQRIIEGLRKAGLPEK
jgi:adenylate cyclase